jgi:hypothetical protein
VRAGEMDKLRTFDKAMLETLEGGKAYSPK